MAIDALHERVSFLWTTTEIDAGYRQALQAILTHLIKPAVNERGQEKRESPLLLPYLCCRSLRGESQSGLTVNAAWVLLYAAFYLLDKVEDEESTEPFSSQLTTSTLLNATTGLILGAELLLADLDAAAVEANAAKDIRTKFNLLALEVCAGQHRDLVQHEPTLQDAWRIAAAKSGAFFALGCYVGARTATENERVLAACSSFGRHLGLLIQIANDIDGLWSSDGCGSDLSRGQWTLPVAYAFHVLPAEKQAMLSALMGTTGGEAEARQLILDYGALIYLALETEKNRRLAENALAAVGDHKMVGPLLKLLHRISQGNQER